MTVLQELKNRKPQIRDFFNNRDHITFEVIVIICIGKDAIYLKAKMKEGQTFLNTPFYMSIDAVSFKSGVFHLYIGSQHFTHLLKNMNELKGHY